MDYLAQQVAQYCHEIALGCQIKFGCTSSGGKAKNIFYYLQELGFDCTYAEGDVNIERMITNIKKGIPQIIGGFNSEGGHAWIIDGMSWQEKEGYTYHCNWGWDGANNGWSYGNPYTIYGLGDNGRSRKYNAYPNSLMMVYINSK